MTRTLDYKTTKYQETIYWASCHSKYGDIMWALWQQYSCGNMAVGEEFPHQPKNTTKTLSPPSLKQSRINKVLSTPITSPPAHTTADGRPLCHIATHMLPL